MVWKVDRELAVLLASGPRALLLQVAHPLVAAGVIDHSRFETDPLGRLHGTLDAIYSFAFADRARAAARVRAVTQRHGHVRGSLAEACGAHPAGAGYSALDPELLLWVYSTLIDSSLLAYDTFVRPLTPRERDDYYQEMRRQGGVWNIPAAVFPASLLELRRWMDEQIASGQVAVSAQARRIARRILAPPVRWLPRASFAPLALVAVGLLPEPLRVGFGYRWGARRQLALERAAALSRAVVPRLPAALRDVPWARAAHAA